MSFSYQNLWNILERYHMSKTDLRQKLGLSTATLAKLSADQPVALEVLDKICEELGCSVGDILTHQPDSLSLAAWSRISDSQTYLLNIFFRLTQEQTDYIYGFATPFQMTEGGMEFWNLSRVESNPDFLMLLGYLSGKQLVILLQSASEKKSIGQLLAEAGITLSLHHCTYTEQDAISSLFLCNGTFSYRPAFLLSANTECAGLLPPQKPLQSFQEETMYCESLFGSKKRALYTVDDFPSFEKLRALWKLFQEELPVHQSINEMARLNNFEVFTPLLPLPESEAAVSWEIGCKEGTKRRVAESIIVHLNHHYLQGAYIVSVRAFNTSNAFLDFCEQIYCGEQDIELRLPLQEGVSRASVKVWKATKGLRGTNLVYSSSHSLIRHFHLDMHLSTRRFQIEDEWTRRMEGEHRPVEKKGEFSSRWPVSFGEEQDEIWLSEEEQVQKDFQNLLSAYDSRNLKGIFFKEGSDKHLEFLAWLKKLLSGTAFRHVILIDPFITSDSISKLLRSISNTDISYDIVTDSCTGKDPEKRIGNIRSMKGFLDVLNPGRLHIYSINTSDKFLHDRFLILLGDDGIPTAYILTNSLDNLAEHHASVALPADKQLSREIFDYYVSACSKLQKLDQLDTLYDSADAKPPKKRAETEEKADTSQKKHTPENFRENFSTDLSAALASLAYMQSEEIRECFDYVLSHNDASIIQQLSELLSKYPEKEDAEDSERNSAHLLSVAQLLLLPFDSQGQLLQSSEYLPNHSIYEYLGRHCDWDIFYAAKLLWQLSPAAYCEQLLLVRQRLGKDRSFSNHRLFCLGALLIGQLVDSLSFSDSDELLDLLLSSKLPFLRTFAVTRLISASIKPFLSSTEPLSDASVLEPALKRLAASLSLKELLFSEVYLIQRLQISICRKPQKSGNIQPFIDHVIRHMIDDILTAALTSDANELFSNDDLYEYLLPLYQRNSEDTCRILQGLKQKGYLSDEAAKQLFIRLFFEKYRSGFSNPEVFFSVNDINESCMILDYLNRTTTDGIASLKRELVKLERQLGERLYHAFLKTRNYSLWKSSIDLFACLIFMELWISKNYGQNPSRAVKEFERLSENFRPTLEKYSDVYKCLLRNFPKLNV